jgi:hypothetical protein
VVTGPVDLDALVAHLPEGAALGAPALDGVTVQ